MTPLGWPERRLLISLFNYRDDLKTPLSRSGSCSLHVDSPNIKIRDFNIVQEDFNPYNSSNG